MDKFYMEETNMNAITLEIEVSGLVVARFDGEHAAHVRELFGTGRITTPWTFKGMELETEHHAANIITQIRAKNPGVPVNWSPERCEQYVAFRFATE
jgi:hypothetical protein